MHDKGQSRPSDKNNKAKEEESRTASSIPLLVRLCVLDSFV